MRVLSVVPTSPQSPPQDSGQESPPALSVESAAQATTVRDMPKLSAAELLDTARRHMCAIDEIVDRMYGTSESRPQTFALGPVNTSKLWTTS